MSNCYGSLQACAIRVAKLDSTGAPDDGASNAYVTDALITVGVDVEISTGDDFEQKNGCGTICQSYKDCDRVKRANLSMDLCVLDYELVGFLTGATVYRDGSSNPIGFQVPAVDSACPNGVYFEVFTKAWDSDQQATDGGNNLYHRWIFPKTKWAMGSITLENGIAVIPLTGIGEANSNLTANGPFNDFPSGVAAAGGITNAYGVILDDVALPTASCSRSTVPAGS